MVITFSSVINITLFSGISILLMQFILKKADMLLYYGLGFIHILMIALLLRFFFPLELPTQNVIGITTIWPDIHFALTKPIVHFAGKDWSRWSLFVVFSSIGSIYFIVKLFISYFAFRFKASRLEIINNSSIHEIVYTINVNFKKATHFKIVRYTEISTPIIFGLWKPYILLPDLDLTNEKWYYVLSHEMSHYYHKDLWIRFICELLQALYWWNPFIYLLRAQITKIQELRVDSMVLNKLDDLNKLNYTECLVQIAKQHADNQQNWTASFSSDSESDVIQRISLLLKKEEYKECNIVKSNLIALLLIFSITLLPNFFLIEPQGMAEEDKGQGISINRSNAFFVLNADGLYDVYVYNEYFSTVDKIFDETIKVYNEYGERIK